jgi:chemotaxis-related protein WspD
MSSKLTLPVVDQCWTSIGVRGDRSCPRLAEVIHCQNCDVFSVAARGLLDRPASEEYLAEVTGFVAEPAEARKAANQSALLFSLGNERFAVWARDVLEVAEVAIPRRIPHRTNGIFRGIVNLQGRLELCVSLAGLLGLDSEAPPFGGKVRVLVVAHNGLRWVFTIDAVRGMHRMHDSALIEIPASAARRDQAYLTGLFTLQEEAFGVLDVPRLCQVTAEQLG